MTDQDDQDIEAAPSRYQMIHALWTGGFSHDSAGRLLDAYVAERVTIERTSIEAAVNDLVTPGCDHVLNLVLRIVQRQS